MSSFWLGVLCGFGGGVVATIVGYVAICVYRVMHVGKADELAEDEDLSCGPPGSD